MPLDKETNKTDFEHSLLISMENYIYIKSLPLSTLLVRLRIRWPYLLQKNKTSPKTAVLCITLNYIWQQDTCSKDLENVKYPFILITPKSTLTWNKKGLEISLVVLIQKNIYQKRKILLNPKNLFHKMQAMNAKKHPEWFLMVGHNFK